MLAIASNTEQQARDHLTVNIWGTGLTTEQFLERELRLRSHPWAAATLTTWLWKDEAGKVLSSCEVFLDEAKAGAKSGTAATIASVFTEPSLRARGHAAKMLQALIEHLSADPRCLAVTLFSEIGTNYYQRLGFCPVPAFDTFFAPRADAPSVEWLQQLPSPKHPNADANTLRLELPASRLDWHLERERIYGAALKRGPLHHHGARMGESTITWTAYWKTNELQVLSLDAKSPAELELLIHAASHAAHLGGLSTVRIWETNDLTSVHGAKRVPRTDEVAMFLPLVPGVQAWTMVERGLWA
ncbi:MAG: GNAT family N-acetyltransferase [Archangium sp.]|nr:GNAT family N-acetyltransferase [Archangium sp.]